MNHFTEQERAAIIARTRQTTRDVLFSAEDSAGGGRGGFNTALYAATFSFCTAEEKRRLFRALRAAWRWGEEGGRP